eukprot:CAMPEP_0116903824 /NCGR_PEP_ID=MMETSP0467-20121206/10993_1 /TAXON_ID=283647 /ORGANISM="Mesodinium pulex, Strain SPMC105" /LENGTH=182 /DNA_ID=CAMNT_0004578231 /DNA_START=376 /DNA_END=926 /DNA_ORIENTATION=+
MTSTAGHGLGAQRETGFGNGRLVEQREQVEQPQDPRSLQIDEQLPNRVRPRNGLQQQGLALRAAVELLRALQLLQQSPSSPQLIAAAGSTDSRVHSRQKQRILGLMEAPHHFKQKSKMFDSANVIRNGKMDFIFKNGKRIKIHPLKQKNIKVDNKFLYEIEEGDIFDDPEILMYDKTKRSNV